MPLRHAAQSPSQLTDSLHRLAGKQSHRPPDFVSGHAYYLIRLKGKSIEAIMRRRRILFAEFVASMEDTRLPKCVMFGELMGGRKKSG